MSFSIKAAITTALFLSSFYGRGQSVQVDSTSIESHYRSDCRLHVHESRLPNVVGFPNADQWNLRVLEFFEQRIAGNCRDAANGEPAEPGMSDTLSYLTCDFRELQRSESVLSIQCLAWFVPHGGNGWWLEHEIFNIDLESGEPIQFPQDLLLQDNERLDAIICEHFERTGGCFEPYHCHSCEHQDFLQTGMKQGHVGIIEGQWTLLEMMWPKPCSHAAESMVSIPLGSLKTKI